MLEKTKIWMKYFLGFHKKTSKRKVKLVKNPNKTTSSDSELLFLDCRYCGGSGITSGVCPKCCGSGMIFKKNTGVENV